MKYLIGSILILSSLSFLFCEDITFRVIEESKLYDANYSYLEGITDVIADIHKDETVQFTDTNVITTDIIKVKSKEAEEKGWMKIDSLSIDQDIPVNFNTILSSSWIMDYYYSVLHSNNPESIFTYESYWKDVWEPGLFDRPDYNWTVYFHPITFEFSKISLIISNLFNYWNVPLIYKSISQSEYSIEISLSNLFRQHYDDTEYLFGMSEVLANLSEFTLIIKIDGDYADIYINDLNNKFCTLAKADEKTISEITTFVINGNVNHENITWPRRADGSSDYEYNETAPVEQSIGSTYQTTYNLRLRTTQETTSDILTTLEKDTKVIVKEIGKKQTIDGITASWVKVQLADGTEGWCFGGYLEEAAPDPEPVSFEQEEIKTDPDPEAQELIQTDKNKTFSIFSILPFAGGALALILVCVILIVRRKK